MAKRTKRVVHQPMPVAGYTGQPDAMVELVNANKRLEEQVLRVLDSLADSGVSDGRWLAIGRTAIEQGFMAVNRSIFKPKRLEENMN